MPFPTQFTPTAGGDAYIRDPEPGCNAQYRCRIMQAEPLAITLYPDADEPPADFTKLPAQYHLAEPSISATDLTAMPALNVPVMGYAQALIQQGADPGDYQAAAKADTGTTAGPMSGIEDAKVPGQSTTPPAKTEGQIPPPTDQNLTPPPPADGAFDPQPGDMVQVVPSEHSYWGPLGGKQGTVLERLGDVMTVEIDGLPYGNIDVARFQAVQKDQKDQEVQTSQVHPDIGKRMGEAQPWIGQLVHVKDATIGSAFRGRCEAVTEDGIKLEGIPATIAWSRVGDICAMDQEPIPGDPKDEARVEKMRADEAATHNEVIDDIQALIAKKASKETFGKREYRPLIDRWNLLKEKLKLVISEDLEAKIREIDSLLLNEKVAKRETLGKREYRPLVEKWEEFLDCLDGKSAPSPEPVQQVLPGTESPPAATVYYLAAIVAAENRGYEKGYKQALVKVRDFINELMA